MASDLTRQLPDKVSTVVGLFLFQRFLELRPVGAFHPTAKMTLAVMVCAHLEMLAIVKDHPVKVHIETSDKTVNFQSWKLFSDNH